MYHVFLSVRLCSLLLAKTFAFFPYAQWTFLHTTTHKLSYFLFVVCCTLNSHTSMNTYFAHASEVLTVCLFWSFTLLLLCSTNLKMYALGFICWCCLFSLRCIDVETKMKRKKWNKIKYRNDLRWNEPHFMRTCAFRVFIFILLGAHKIIIIEEKTLFTNFHLACTKMTTAHIE